jgi:outer membrane protein assembly factor BamD
MVSDFARNGRARRVPVIALLGLLLLITAACTNKKVNNPLSNVGSKQPDKVLFDRAMDAMKHNRFDVARMTLQTLINTYPDSEYVARAKLAIGDSWYAEGGSASLAQAEIEYKDFITFFPNMPEAAEAQLKIANIHYQEMEKPDRDYTHAMRAEEEYRALILQFPDSKLVPEAKQRLREVQEVLAEREYEIGHFYYMRQSYPAAIARLQSLADKYPLYSQADEVLFLLGQSYESEANLIRGRQMDETMKSKLIDNFNSKAAAAYDKILTRYPLADRAGDAKARLEAMKMPVPKATAAAVAENKAEIESRTTESMYSHFKTGLGKHPSVALASKVGDPVLVDPTPMSATDVTRDARDALLGKSSAGGDNNSLAVETVNGTTPPPSEAVPHSPDSPAAAPTTAASVPPQPGVSSGDLQPTAPADSNELKVDPPATDQTGATVQPPAQINEIKNATPGDANAATGTSTTASTDPSETSTSKPKKKKGIHKVIPF